MAGWWNVVVKGLKIASKSGALEAAAAGLARHRGQAPAPTVEGIERPAGWPAPAVVPGVPAAPITVPAEASGLEAPAAARLAVLSIPHRLTDMARERLAVSMRRALEGFGDIRLIALEEGIGIRFYEVGGAEISAAAAGQVLDVQAWKIDALEALQAAIDAIEAEAPAGALPGAAALSRAAAKIQIKAAAAKLIGIHPAIVDPRR